MCPLPDAILHLTTMVVGECYALAGSVNFDMRSVYLNFELITIIHERSGMVKLLDWVEDVQSDSMLWASESPGVLREILEGRMLLAAFQL